MDRLLRAVIKINNIMGSLLPDLSQVLSAVICELTKLFPAYKVKLCFADISDEEEGLAHLIRRGMVGCQPDCPVVQEGLPILRTGGEDAQGCTACADEAAAAAVCVPVMAGREIIGSLSMRSAAAQPVTRDELEVLVSTANQVGVAVQRSRLLWGLQREKSALEKANKEVLALNQELTGLLKHLQNTQAQLIRSEKLAAAGRLAANLAHEINNPTGIILSRLDCVFLDQPTDARLVNDLHVIQRQAQRIADVTRGLLTFTRQERARQSRPVVDLHELVQETCTWLDGQFARRGISLQLRLAQVPPLPGNREQLQQVLVNLLANARDAMPAGGTITVKLSLDPEGCHVVMEVSDTGQGIPENELDKIFEPFYTSKDPGEGTGLGLFVTYSLIKEHQGEITVASTVGQGTTFTIRLPFKKTTGAGREPVV